ncbi:MAG: hypothetical protein ACU0AU_04835 [Cognatishimia activa]
MQFINQKYVVDPLSGERTGIQAAVDGKEMSIPLDVNNRFFAELVRQVAEEGLVIEEAEPVVAPVRRIGKPREFLHLFTDTEKAAFFKAKQSDVQLELWWAEASTGDFSLDHPTVSAGLSGLVAAGILTQARSEEILASDFNDPKQA